MEPARHSDDRPTETGGPAGRDPEGSAEGHGSRRERDDTDPSHRTFYCDLCGNVMLNLHCKLICERCGYKRDCSDP